MDKERVGMLDTLDNNGFQKKKYKDIFKDL